MDITTVLCNRWCRQVVEDHAGRGDFNSKGKQTKHVYFSFLINWSWSHKFLMSSRGAKPVGTNSIDFETGSIRFEDKQTTRHGWTNLRKIAPDGEWQQVSEQLERENCTKANYRTTCTVESCYLKLGYLEFPNISKSNYLPFVVFAVGSLAQTPVIPNFLSFPSRVQNSGIRPQCVNLLNIKALQSY